MSHTEEQKKRKLKSRLFTGSIIGICLALILFLSLKSCSENISPVQTQIALQKNGKTYMFSPLGTAAVEMIIKKADSPAAMNSLAIYKDDGVYYVAPLNMKPLIDVMSGDIVTHDLKEESYDGYITSGTNGNYKLESKLKSTKTIGEQVRKYTLTLTNKNGKEMKVKWKQNAKSGEYKGMKNCEVKSFWIQTNPSPGETVVSGKDFLVIPVEDLAEFFGCKFEFNTETNVFFVKQ